MKILIADDELIPRQLLQFQLEQSGFSVITATNGAQAWELLQAHHCSVVIADWMMHEMSGLELIRRIRKSDQPGYVYVILLTSKSERAEVVTGLTTGADDFLTKPFDRNELLARVHSGLRIIELERNLGVRNRELGLRNRQLSDTNGKMKRNLEAAAKIQQAFLPIRGLKIPDVSIAWRYLPCDELAGDMLNILPFDDEHVGVYVLDVSGHGVQAALLAVTASRYLSIQKDPSSVLWHRPHSAAEYQLMPPAAAVAELNSRMMAQSLTEQYFTLIYGILNQRTGEFRYTVAGHPSAVHLSDLGIAAFLPGEGLPIGIAETEYEEHSVHLAPGDRLFFYTDGVTESMNCSDELFGNVRFRNAITAYCRQPVEDVLQQVLDDIKVWCGGTPLHDDVSLLALEFAPEPASHSTPPGLSRISGRQSFGFAMTEPDNESVLAQHCASH